MVKAAYTMEVNMEAIKIKSEVKHMMPAWLHPAVPKRTYHSGRDKCLVTTHNVSTVWDLTVLARRLEQRGRGGANGHGASPKCECAECKKDRANGCENPHKCVTIASSILGKIYPKLNPLQTQTPDGLSLTPARIEKARQALVDMEGTVQFNPLVTVKDTLDKCFRVFTGPSNLGEEPAVRVSRATRGMNLTHERVVVTVESVCHNEGRPDAECMGGAWCEGASSLSGHMKAQNQKSTRLSAELTILVRTLKKLDPVRPVTIRMSLRMIVEGLTQHLCKWENEGWINVPY
jgi:hypothetical protein